MSKQVKSSVVLMLQGTDSQVLSYAFAHLMRASTNFLDCFLKSVDNAGDIYVLCLFKIFMLQVNNQCCTHQRVMAPEKQTGE